MGGQPTKVIELIWSSIESGNLNDVKTHLSQVPTSTVNSYILEYHCIPYAVLYNKPNILEYLILQGLDVNGVGTNKRTALSLAIEQDSLPLVTTLVSNGADINKCDNTGIPPLVLALQLNKLQIAQVLIKSGANVNTTRIEGKTLVSWAVCRNNVSLVEFLLQNGAIFSTHSALLEAISCRNLDMDKFLHQKGARVDLKKFDGYAPLHKAVEVGHVDIVKYLVENGASVNHVDERNKTPLKMAADKEDFVILDFLVKSGANVEGANIDVEIERSTGLDFKIYWNLVTEEVEKKRIREESRSDEA